MNAKDRARIKGGVRQAFKYSQSFQLTKKRARREKQEGLYKNGRQKTRVYYVCNHCGKYEKDRNIEIDHINPIGKFSGDWNDWIDKVFCGEENLQVLCKSCHKKKGKNNKLE